MNADQFIATFKKRIATKYSFHGQAALADRVTELCIDAAINNRDEAELLEAYACSCFELFPHHALHNGKDQEHNIETALKYLQAFDAMKETIDKRHREENFGTLIYDESYYRVLNDWTSPYRQLTRKL